MRYGLKARAGLSPQQGMVPTVERGHLESYFFEPIIVQRAEYHIKCNFSRTPRFPTRNDTSKGCAAFLDAAPVYFHLVERVLVNEV